MSPWGSGLLSQSCFFPDVTGSSGIRVLPQGYGWNLLYGSLLLGLVGGVCTLGAGLYARASFLTFLLVSGSLASVLISFVAVGPRDIQLAPRPGTNGSSVPPRYGHFTGFNGSTLKDNLGGEMNTPLLGVGWGGTWCDWGDASVVRSAQHPGQAVQQHHLQGVLTLSVAPLHTCIHLT